MATEQLIAEFSSSDVTRLQDNSSPFLFLASVAIYETSVASHVCSHSLASLTEIHWPGDPTVPASIILEAISQAAGFYICFKNEFKYGHSLVLGVDFADFLRKVDGKADLFITARVTERAGKLYRFKSRVMCEGKLVAKAGILMSEL